MLSSTTVLGGSISMRFVRVKGKQKALDDNRLIFASMNLKKFANWSWKKASITWTYLIKGQNTHYLMQAITRIYI